MGFIDVLSFAGCFLHFAHFDVVGLIALFLTFDFDDEVMDFRGLSIGHVLFTLYAARDITAFSATAGFSS